MTKIKQLYKNTTLDTKNNSVHPFQYEFMSQVQRSSLQSLHRTHSFINRTPHTVLNIVGKKNSNDIITKMESTIMAKCTNQKLSALVNSSNVRCIRIDECQIQNNQQFMQVPCIVADCLFTNLLKLAITKCNLQTIKMKVEVRSKKQKQTQCIFPNLQQIDLSDNKLLQIPTFIYDSRKLKKINMNKNNVNKLDDQLKQLQNLKYIDIFENNIGYLSVKFLIWARQSGLVIDYEWKLDFLSICIYKIGQQEKTQINNTQGEQIEIAAQEQSGSAHSYRDRLGQYLDIGQVLKYLIKRVKQNSLEMKIQKEIEHQYLQLLSYEHIQYIKHFQEYVIIKDYKMIIKYIQRCLKQRYYKSMDYLLNLANLFHVREQKKEKLNILIEEKQYREQKQNIILVGKKRIKMLTKTHHENKCRNKIISLQSPTSFYQITNHSNLTERSYKTNNIVKKTKEQFKRNGRQNKNKNVIEERTRDKVRKSQIQNIQYQKESSIGKSGEDQIPSTQEPINNPNRVKLKNQSPFKTNGYSTILSPFQQSENCLWMAKLVSYNISHIQSIPLSVLLQINLSQYTWFLNQLQYVYKYLIKNNSKPNALINTIYLKSIFKSKPIVQMSNNLITNENLLQYILNSVSYKLAIKLLLTSSSLEFLSHYNFSSPSIIKSILLFDDYQLFSFFVNSYKKFADVLFGGFSNRYFHHCSGNNVVITKSITLENEMSAKKVHTDNKYSKWQQIVRPHSKLYKILYKKQKQHIKKQIKENNSKNWHFPQYIQPQTFIVRNDVYDYEVLKDYEQFQSSFLYKDLKLQIRSNFTNKYNHFSIAKKIYMDVVQQMNGLIRNLGKSKNKSNKKSSVYHNNNKSDVYSAEAWINSNKKNGTLSASLLPSNATEGRLKNISININTDLNKTLKSNQSKSILNSQFFTNNRSYKKQLYATKQNIHIEKDIHRQLQSQKSSIPVLSKREKQNDNTESGEQDLKSFQIRERKKKGINVMRNSQLNSCSKSQRLGRSQIQLTPYEKILRENIKQLQLTQKRTIYLDLKSNSNKNNEQLKESFKNLSKTDRLNEFHLSRQECQIFNSQQVLCSTFDIS